MKLLLCFFPYFLISMVLISVKRATTSSAFCDLMSTERERTAEVDGLVGPIVM